MARVTSRGTRHPVHTLWLRLHIDSEAEMPVGGLRGSKLYPKHREVLEERSVPQWSRIARSKSHAACEGQHTGFRLTVVTGEEGAVAPPPDRGPGGSGWCSRAVPFQTTFLPSAPRLAPLREPPRARHFRHQGLRPSSCEGLCLCGGRLCAARGAGGSRCPPEEPSCRPEPAALVPVVRGRGSLNDSLCFSISHPVANQRIQRIGLWRHQTCG